MRHLSKSKTFLEQLWPWVKTLFMPRLASLLTVSLCRFLAWYSQYIPREARHSSVWLVLGSNGSYIRTNVSCTCSLAWHALLSFVLGNCKPALPNGCLVVWLAWWFWDLNCQIGFWVRSSCEGNMNMPLLVGHVYLLTYRRSKGPSTSYSSSPFSFNKQILSRYVEWRMRNNVVEPRIRKC